MKRVALLTLFVFTVVLLPESASAQSYWLGRKADPKQEEFIFDVAVPESLASILTCSDPKYARLKKAVEEFQWEVKGKSYTFLEVKKLSWKGDEIEREWFHLGINETRESEAVRATDESWKACKEVFVAQKKPLIEGWFEATPVLLKIEGKDNPQLTVNLNDAPFQVARHPFESDSAIGARAPTKNPQIVPVVHKNDLYIAWQSWSRDHPTGKVFVSKVGIDQLEQGKLTAVRDVPSGGTLVGFTLDDAGADYILTAKTETFANQPSGDFLDTVHNVWRSDIVTLYTKGKGTDLNNRQNTVLPFYGMCNAGTGRLIAAGDQLAAVFARRHYTPKDGIIHQEANALFIAKNLSKTFVKADNTVGHSLDQRLIFDGRDFVSLHQADMFPFAGLLIEKLRKNPGREPPLVRFPVYACPTFRNDVFFELGGLAAEKDGYPVLFTATHNTESVNDKNVAAKRDVAWDLAMAYVTRNFDTKPASRNPFDILASGILAKGYAEPEGFTVDNVSWDPKAADWSMLAPRKIMRQVCWLTSYDQDQKETKKATVAKLIKLRQGKYVAIWEEQVLAGKSWQFIRTMGTTLTIEGDLGNKRIKKEPPRQLSQCRLHRGDDPVTLTMGGVPHAAWVTAGRTNKQLILHTLDEKLTYKEQVLAFP